jgi:FdhE protein
VQGTTRGLRTEPAARLADLEAQRPEWHAWLRLLAEAERALNDAGWSTPFADAESAGGAGASEQTPLLHGRTLEVDATAVRRLVSRLASTAAAGKEVGAASLRGYRPTADAAVGLLATAVRQDRAAIGALAHAGGLDLSALASLADLASLPLLHSCGRLLAARVPRSWPHGYCPICAAWPILSERRGLDRTRRLRCGRCGGDWEVQWLCCIYCGEREHERLGSLVLEDEGERLKVETCASCRGYLKSVATLQGIPAFELLLQDLETVELDLVALDRGYRRPQESGFALDARVMARASRPIWQGSRHG